MKKLIISALLFVSCYSDYPGDYSASCTEYSELCNGYPYGVSFEVCTNEFGLWWVVDGREYQDIDEMAEQECDF